MKHVKVIKRRQGRTVSGEVVNFIFLLVFGLFMFLPMLFIIGNAFKPMDEMFVYPPRFFPRHPTLGNFKALSTLFSESMVPFSRYFVNTLMITGIGAFGHVVIASMAAYVFEKRPFPGSNIIFKLVVTSLMFTSSVTAIPSYLIMSRLGWIDSSLAVIVPALGSTMGVFLMKQFMCGFPDTILEAARIDGASEHYIFRKIVMPNVKPACFTLIIFCFQSMWSTTGNGYIFSEDKKPLMTALNQVVSSGISRTGVSAAISLLMMIVPIVVFVISQSNVMETMVSSGMKD